MNDEVYFWHTDKHQSLLQVYTIILGVCTGPILAVYCIQLSHAVIFPFSNILPFLPFFWKIAPMPLLSRIGPGVTSQMSKVEKEKHGGWSWLLASR